MSTTGVSEVTVMVSATAPTRRSALMVKTPAPETSTPSRFTVVNPVNANVTEYVPGSRSTTRYCPVPSVSAVRVFSMSTGLDTSTVTPGRTPPDGSLTVPAMVACASTVPGKTTAITASDAILKQLRMAIPPALCVLCHVEAYGRTSLIGQVGAGELALSAGRADSVSFISRRRSPPQYPYSGMGTVLMAGHYDPMDRSSSLTVVVRTFRSASTAGLKACTTGCRG